MPFPLTRPRRVWLLSVLLFLGTGLLFSRSVGFGFVDFDDGLFVFNNPQVQAGLTGDSLRWVVAGESDFWIPLARLSLVVDGQFYGQHAWGYHLTSLLWHAANAVLVFLVLRRLTGSCWGAACCAALFAWHPLRVESVTWVSERKDVMSGFFFLLTLWSYAGYVERRRTGATGIWRQYACTLLWFLCGLLSKPMLVTLPGVLLLLDVWPLRRASLPSPPGGAGFTPAIPIASADRSAPDAPTTPWIALLLEKLPFLALSGLCAAIAIRTQETAGAFVLQLPVLDRLANAAVSVARYLGKIFWPFDLAVIYPHPGTWPAPAVCGALLLLFVLTTAGLWQWRRRPWLLVGWLWFLGTLVPAIGFVQVGIQALADRYTYLPGLGLTLALVWTLRAVPLARPAKFTLAGLALLGCAVRTVDQQGNWRSSVALYEHALASTADNAALRTLLGCALLNEGRDAEAEHQIHRALELDPRNPTALSARASILSKQGRLAEAAADQRSVLALNPRDADTAFALGLVQLKQHLPVDAAASFEMALTLKPDRLDFLLPLAELEAATGKGEAAIRRCEAALARHPAEAALHTRYSGILAQLGNATGALAHAEEALKLAPTAPIARANYANALRLTGRLAEACEQYRQAAAVAPDDADIHFGLGIALKQNREPDAALAEFETAARLRPSLTAAHVEIGEILFARGEAAPAAARFRQALSADPSVVPALLGLARAAVKLGAYDEAAASLGRAIELQPANPEPYSTWAEILVRQGRFAEAIPPYEKSVGLQPADAGAHAALGYALFFAGRRADARREWEEALRLNPDFPKLRERLEALPQ